MATINAPVWKNTEKSVTWTASPYTYSIVMADTPESITVFSGKAWVRPGEEFLKININNIAQNYLTSDLPDLREITSNTTYDNIYACRQFYLVDSQNVTSDTYNFLLDYSYEDVDMTRRHNMSEPINGHGTSGMFFLSTEFYAGELKVKTHININAGSSFDDTHCGKYAIYYLNSHGGWDSFLLEGNCVRTDTYKRNEMNSSYDNTKLDFGKKVYNNVTTPSWDLKTGWLSNSEAEILVRNLLPSVKAYLHNLVTDEITPVNITDGSGIYKTYMNQGRKRVSYTIKAEAAQNKVYIIK